MHKHLKSIRQLNTARELSPPQRLLQRETEETGRKRGIKKSGARGGRWEGPITHV